MKFDELRAAAHNLADSLASGCSLAFRAYDVAIWEWVERTPDHRLHIDILSGRVFTREAPAEANEFFETLRARVPAFLHKNGCDPDLVSEVELQFVMRSKGPLRANEVLVTVRDSAGKAATDRYVGCPLHRTYEIDTLGRVRRERWPIGRGD